MTKSERLVALKEIKSDFLRQLNNICAYHKEDTAKVQKATLNIGTFFDFLIGFFEGDFSDNGGRDGTAKKAFALKMIDSYSLDEMPEAISSNAAQSSIENLFYVALDRTMPEHISDRAELVFQVPALSKWYRMDIVLIEKVSNRRIIKLECKGFNEHYSSKEKILNDTQRDTALVLEDLVPLINYSGSDIYNRYNELAKDFWKAIEREIYPRP